MKKIKLLFLFMPFIGLSQINVKVEVTNLKSDKGQVLIGVYNSKENFLAKEFKGNIAAIKNRKSTAIFTNIPKGEYAFSVFHDENRNNKIDFNFLGIPKERYGFSNRPRPFLGPPKYDDTKIRLDKDAVISIEIN